MSLISFFSKARVYVAIIFLLITLAAIVYGGIPLTLFMGTLIFAGNFELLNIMKAKGFEPSVLVIALFNVAFIVTAHFNRYDLFGAVCTFAVIATFIAILIRNEKARIVDAAITILAIMYGGFLPAHILLLRSLNNEGLSFYGVPFSDGLGFIIMIFFIITASDVFGYYIGTNFGKTKLSPVISPKKTVEGAIGSTVGSIIFAMLVGYFVNLDLVHSFIAGVLLTAAAQFGDLVESMMKRDVGIKDSGSLLPGHGGILDRADSYIFTVAVAYYYFKFFVV